MGRLKQVDVVLADGSTVSHLFTDMHLDENHRLRFWHFSEKVGIHRDVLGEWKHKAGQWISFTVKAHE